MSKFIHLLYVPTMNCNMQCKYCYLGESTGELESDRGYLETLRYAVEKLKSEDVIPFNISLHGGEVTTLSRTDFRDLVAYISDYYRDHRQLLQENGFKPGKPHIKTNLYSLDRHIDTLREFDVSISGSLDLPLSMHDTYRITRGGKGTLETILKNIRLLESLPNRKKVSSTIFHEHFERLDEIVSDIRYLSENTCLNMNDFNFMIGFTPAHETDVRLTALSEDEQVQLYDRMHAEFESSPLREGLENAWFAEFTPAYCTNCDNCGEKFFLLEKNGDIYSCVRGQGRENFYYGNIYTDSVKTILSNARTKIFLVHNRSGFDPECAQCGYLQLCKTGCPFVKELYASPKSYTCRLQKRIYRDMGYAPDSENDYPYQYLKIHHPEIAAQYLKPAIAPGSLADLIAKDEKLQKVYDPDAFILQIDDIDFPLRSQLLKQERDFVYLTPDTSVILYTRHDVLDALSDYPINNALYIMLLSGDTVVYGDEQREKQAHVMTHLIYKYALLNEPSDREGYFRSDLTDLLSLYSGKISKDRANNLFFTTVSLRDYHYTKQKNNAYYHIEAINLPFQNIEFYYLDRDYKEVFPWMSET